MNLPRYNALLLILVGLLCCESATAQTLKIATLAPEGSKWMIALKTASAEIKAQTDGRVKLKLYGGGVQGTDQNVIRKIRVGQLHGFTTTGGGLSALHRDAGLYSLPLMFNNVDEAAYVRARMDSRLRQALEDAGWVNFGFSFSGFAHLMSNKPVSSLKDLEKLRIWVPEDDRIGFDAIRTLGGAPVQMPMTDVLTGLQTDLLDTVVTSPMGAVVFQWHGQVRYVTELPLVYLYSALVIHRKPFSRIAPVDQAIVRETLEAAHRSLDQSGADDDARFMSALIDSGIQPLTVDPSQISSWRNRVLTSNRRLGEQGEFSLANLNELEAHLANYRRQGQVVSNSGAGSHP
jgi:TRAP-type C4-dicarboxylate transport system substrate-binding protein